MNSIQIEGHEMISSQRRYIEMVKTAPLLAQ